VDGHERLGRHRQQAVAVRERSAGDQSDDGVPMAGVGQSADQVDPETADSLPGRSSAGIEGAVAARWWRMVERWSPVGLRGARTDPGRRGAAVLVLVAVVAALAAGAAAWHSRPRPEAVPPPAVLSRPDPATSAGPSASAASIVVAVTGKVRHPGVVSVPGGARVIDAVQAAGGPLPGADLGTLNLARKLTDGELVAVGVPGPAPVVGGDTGSGGAPAGGTSGPVDLNTATLAELDTLPGVGPVLAQRILDWRTAHGQFASVDQLADVPGIGESRMAQLRDLVRV
jgi:competence protein ComEA